MLIYDTPFYSADAKNKSWGSRLINLTIQKNRDSYATKDTFQQNDPALLPYSSWFPRSEEGLTPDFWETTSESAFSEYCFLGSGRVGINVNFIFYPYHFLCKPWSRGIPWVGGAVSWHVGLGPTCLERYKRILGNHLWHTCTFLVGKETKKTVCLGSFWDSQWIENALLLYPALHPSIKLNKSSSRLKPIVSYTYNCQLELVSITVVDTSVMKYST